MNFRLSRLITAFRVLLRLLPGNKASFVVNQRPLCWISLFHTKGSAEKFPGGEEAK